jgi:hypothetical protein
MLSQGAPIDAYTEPGCFMNLSLVQAFSTVAFIRTEFLPCQVSRIVKAPATVKDIQVQAGVGFTFGGIPKQSHNKLKGPSMIRPHNVSHK